MMRERKLRKFSGQMTYHEYHRKIAVQYLKTFISLLKNLPAAVILFSSLARPKKKYRLSRWFLLLPYFKPHTRVFCEWVSEYSSSEHKILDLGCGICSVEAALLNRGFKDIVCIDNYSLYLKVARELLRKYRELPLIRADASFVPLSGQIFDVIAVLDVSYFGSMNLEVCFSEISRLLKPGGILIIDFYEISMTRYKDRKLYSMDDVVKLAIAHKLHPIRFLPLYHHPPWGVYSFGYIMMARKEQ